MRKHIKFVTNSYFIQKLHMRYQKVQKNETYLFMLSSCIFEQLQLTFMLEQRNTTLWRSSKCNVLCIRIPFKIDDVLGLVSIPLIWHIIHTCMRIASMPCVDCYFSLSSICFFAIDKARVWDDEDQQHRWSIPILQRTNQVQDYRRYTSVCKAQRQALAWFI
jgi:hypothetical protein